MNYDENMDSFGSPNGEQDDLWLNDLKSLLDEDPGTAPSPGNMPAHSMPPQQYQMPAQPAMPSFGQVQAPDFNPGFQFQQPAAQPFPGADPYQQEPRQMPYSDFDMAEQQEEKPRKKGCGAIITLSILIILEALAIAAVVLHWMQWME